ncbi:unnamed protein product [Haemonchus placei]|uniref:GLOBIN domain-containing protein n=1 Tax=Haemonchus placei TaxID=6290 RepID=A0A3P7TWL8_HAEPC|nr:unnamed protein product [Haemonchus placei]
MKSNGKGSLVSMILRSASISSTAMHYNYDDRLNRMQRRALRFTWHRLQTRNGGKRVENVLEEVFDRMVRALPSAKDMFTTRMFLCAMSKNETASLRDHAKVSNRHHKATAFHLLFLFFRSVFQFVWKRLITIRLDHRNDQKKGHCSFIGGDFGSSP